LATPQSGYEDDPANT